MAVSEVRGVTLQFLFHAGNLLGEQVEVLIFQKTNLPVIDDLKPDIPGGLVPEQNEIIARRQPEKSLAAIDTNAEIAILGVPEPRRVKRPGVVELAAANTVVLGAGGSVFTMQGLPSCQLGAQFLDPPDSQTPFCP